MPQAATAMRTWPLPASGMGFSTSLKGIPGLVISTALIVLAMRSYLLVTSDAGDARKERGLRSGVVHFARGAQPRIERALHPARPRRDVRPERGELPLGAHRKGAPLIRLLVPDEGRAAFEVLAQGRVHGREALE